MAAVQTLVWPALTRSVSEMVSSRAPLRAILCFHRSYFFSFRILSPLSRAQTFQKSFSAVLTPARYLAANLADVLISIRGRRVGAKRKSTKATIYKIGFGWRQLTSAFANQYPILLVHMFSPFMILPFYIPISALRLKPAAQLSLTRRRPFPFKRSWYRYRCHHIHRHRRSRCD